MRIKLLGYLSVILISRFFLSFLAKSTALRLIDSIRAVLPVPALKALEIFFVSPLKVPGLPGPACSLGCLLILVSIGICLQKDSSVPGLYLIFIKLSRLDLRDKKLENSGVIKIFHLIHTAVPGTSVTDHTDPHGPGRIDGKTYSLCSFNLGTMCSEKLISFIVGA